MQKRIEQKIDKLEDIIPLEVLEEEKKQIERAKNYIIEEKKWINEIVARVDIVPEEENYYEKLSIKPGFDFYQALITCKDRLDRL